MSIPNVDFHHGLLGLLCGSASGVVVWRVRETWRTWCVLDRGGLTSFVNTCIILAALIGNLAAQRVLLPDDTGYDIVPSYTSVFCLSCIALALLRFQWLGLNTSRLRPGLSVFANPYSMVAVTVGVACATFDQHVLEQPALTQALVAAAYLGLVVLLTFALQSPRFAHRPKLQSGVLSAAIVTAVVVDVTGVAVSTSQSVLSQPARGAAPIQANGASPSVFLIVMDTVRADHLSLYGYHRDTTPSLSALADTGTTYERAIASGDMTLHTHGSLFTSKYAYEHGAHRTRDFPVGVPLAESHVTLAELLAEAGYSTKAVVSNHAYLGWSWGMAQGF